MNRVTVKYFFQLWLWKLRQKPSLFIGFAVFVILLTVLIFFFIASKGDDNFSKIIISQDNVSDNFKLVASSSDSLGVEASSTYVLSSKEVFDTAELKKNIQVSPNIDFLFNQISEKEWELQPKNPLSANEIFRVSLTASYLDSLGLEGSHEYEWAFQVKSGFKVLNYLPQDTAANVPIDTGIEITFSHDNFADYEKYFSITPNVEGRFEKHGRTLVFVSSGLRPGQIYNVKIKEGMPLSGSAEVLQEGLSFDFETSTEHPRFSPDAPWFRVYKSLQNVNTTETPLIQVSARNIPNNKLETSVYALRSEAEYLDILNRRDKLPWWSYSKERYLEDVSSRSALSTFSLPIQEESRVNFVRFASPLPKGYFLVELRSGNQRGQILMQVTDVASYVNVAKDKTIVWVANLANKQPESGAVVEIVGTGKTFQSNNQGVVVFDTPQELINASSDKQNNKRYYFKITSGSNELIMPATYLSKGHGSFVDNKKNDYWKYLYTDRPLYQPTDSIKFWGLLRGRDKIDVKEPVTVTLYKSGYVDYYYQPVVVETKTVELDSLGTYEGEFFFENLNAGGYKVDLSVGDDVIASKYIQIKPYKKPAYQLSLVPEKKIAYAGETIKIEARASFFEGTPVPDLDLSFDSPEGEQKITTDSEGKAEILYTADYSACTKSYRCWPNSHWLTLEPSSSELSEIDANSFIRFYGPSVYAETKVTYPQKAKANLEVKVGKLDIGNEEERSRYWRPDVSKLVPSVGTRVEGEVTKIFYVRKKTGTQYDFINKRTYDTYDYTKNETKVDSFSGFTDGRGIYNYTKNLEPETSYSIKIKYYDAEGRYDSTSSYMYYYDGFNLNYYSGYSYDYYRLMLPEDNAFSVGENVEIKFVNNDQVLPGGGSNYYLYLQQRNGLQEYQVSQNSKYNFAFESRDIPNINIAGVYFNGSSFAVAETGWVGNSVLFDKKDKELQIEATPNKANYKPGEEVELSIKTKDTFGRPISAAVNLNLIDEAFYAIIDETANPLDAIYSGIWSGSVFSAYSHERPKTPFGGAEIGGCFVAGTQILMKDGTSKNIEDIETGDEVMTLSDPTNFVQSSGVVVELYDHIISEYLIINEELKVTPEHLVYSNLSFVPAGDLEEGDWMLNSDGDAVFVTSIEIVKDIVPVYNFKVDPDHNYFADGYFVHNDKGEGPREFFTDAALFQTVITDSSGSGKVSFTLPDNITSWRITAQGVSSNLDVGTSASKIPVSLPVFAEVTIGDEYLSGDEPHARIRSYGSALRRGDAVTLSVASEGLGIDDSNIIRSSAFKSEFFELPKLKQGKYDVTYSLTSNKGNDSILLPIEAVGSRLLVDKTEEYEAKNGFSFTNNYDTSLSVLISDKQRSSVYKTLRKLNWSYGGRIDQGIARSLSAEWLNEYFGTNKFKAKFVPSDYQGSLVGLTLLPYSSEDLELSARVANLGVEGFDYEALTQYFFNKLEDKNSNKEEVTLALYGLASTNQPVLSRLRAWVLRDDLTVKERLYSGLAAHSLGDGELARRIYLDVVSEYGAVDRSHALINAGATQDEKYQNTALAAILATYLDASEQYSFVSYLRNKKPENILLNIEELNFAKANLEKLIFDEATVDISIDNERIEAELERPSFAYSLELKPGETLKINKTPPNLFITINIPTSLYDSDINIDSSMSIEREYYVDGKKTNTFNENDLVEVRLEFKFSESSEDRYQIIDNLPSGLLPITRLYRGYDYGCNYRYPYNTDGNQVKYVISSSWLNSDNCDSDGKYITYYARVKTKGTYRVEPAVIQSIQSPNYLNFTSKQPNIVIK